MTDAVEVIRQSMQEEAADELGGSKGHHFELVVVTIVAPAEVHLIAVEPDQAVVGDGDAVRVAAEPLSRLGLALTILTPLFEKPWCNRAT